MNHAPTWTHHPIVMFAVPLILLLVTPKLYNFMVPPEYTLRAYNEDQLQEIASLMDDIYTTLANMTYIPASAIKRGPHQINASAIPCKRNAAVMRLMEIMPYVDAIEVDPVDAERTDWILGGSLVDYRRPDHLDKNCDPIYAVGNSHEEPWFRLESDIVAISDWGTGGWNFDRTLVMLYDTSRNAIRAFEGEAWVGLRSVDDAQSDEEDCSGIGLFKNTHHDRLAILPETDPEWHDWLDAPKLLTRILDAYQMLVAVPWDNSVDGHWGVRTEVIKELLRRNGWPTNFDGDQFNADFIRAKHKSSGKGHAEAAFETMEKLAGFTDEYGRWVEGRIWEMKDALPRLEKTAANPSEEESRLYWQYRAAKEKWDLEVAEADLEIARRDIERFCPDGVCVAKEDLILWDFQILDAAYQKFQRSKTPEEKCQDDLSDKKAWISHGPARHDNCVAQRQREARWFTMAYEQVKSEALQHCAESGRSLLIRPTFEESTMVNIKELKDIHARFQKRITLLDAWKDNLPPLQRQHYDHPHQERQQFNIDLDANAEGASRVQQEIEKLQAQLAEEVEIKRVCETSRSP